MERRVVVEVYLGTTGGRTFTTWTVMECLVSLSGLGGVLLLSIFV